MGEYFTSFADAWAAFLARTEALESFYDEFPEGGFAGEVWVIEPTPEVKRAALRVQCELEQFDFLEIVPHHFMHVAAPPVAVASLTTAGPLELEYVRVNCFHTAVVAEVGVSRRGLVGPPTFLPHFTLALVKRPAPPDDLRRVLESLRETAFGTQRVDEVLLVHVEVSRERGLEPWTVRERIQLK